MSYEHMTNAKNVAGKRINSKKSEKNTKNERKMTRGFTNSTMDTSCISASTEKELIVADTRTSHKQDR